MGEPKTEKMAERLLIHVDADLKGWLAAERQRTGVPTAEFVRRLIEAERASREKQGN